MIAAALAQVLAQHVVRGLVDHWPMVTVICLCGDEGAADDHRGINRHLAVEELIARHQAEVIQASKSYRGPRYGPELTRSQYVQAKQSEAWSEGFKTGEDWAEMRRMWFDDPPAKPTNPYRKVNKNTLAEVNDHAGSGS